MKTHTQSVSLGRDDDLCERSHQLTFEEGVWRIVDSDFLFTNGCGNPVAACDIDVNGDSICDLGSPLGSTQL